MGAGRRRRPALSTRDWSRENVFGRRGGDRPGRPTRPPLRADAKSASGSSNLATRRWALPRPSRPTTRPRRYPPMSLERVCLPCPDQARLPADPLPPCPRGEKETGSRRADNSAQGETPPRAGFGNDPSAGSPTETLLRLLLPLDDQVRSSSRRTGTAVARRAGTNPRTSLNHPIGSSDGRCVQRAGT